MENFQNRFANLLGNFTLEGDVEDLEFDLIYLRQGSNNDIGVVAHMDMNSGDLAAIELHSNMGTVRVEGDRIEELLNDGMIMGDGYYISVMNDIMTRILSELKETRDAIQAAM